MSDWLPKAVKAQRADGLGEGVPYGSGSMTGQGDVGLMR